MVPAVQRRSVVEEREAEALHQRAMIRRAPVPDAPDYDEPVAACAPDPHVPSQFDVRSRWYDARYDEVGPDRHALRARLEAVLELVGDRPGTALDAGMGPGRLAFELASRGWKVSGVDVSDEMVALARQRLPEAADRLVRAELDALPFADATFDAAVATGVLEYAGARPSLAELVRVLRPGGRLVVTYPNPRTAYGIWKTRAYYPFVRLAKRVTRRPPIRMAPGVGEKIEAAAFESLLREAGVTRDETRFVSYLVLLSPLDELLPGPAERLGRRFEGSTHHWLATQVVYAARKPG